MMEDDDMTTDLESITIDGDTFAFADVATDPRKFLELYANRCNDLAHEYAGRVASERLNTALDNLAGYTEHCDVYYDCADVCTCGLDGAQQRVRAARIAWEQATSQRTIYARFVALGRACVAYERAKGTPQEIAAHATYLERLKEAMV